MVMPHGATMQIEACAVRPADGIAARSLVRTPSHTLYLRIRHSFLEHTVESKTCREFWKQKQDADVARDRRADGELRALKWRVARIWEHEMKRDPALPAIRVRRRIGRMTAG